MKTTLEIPDELMREIKIRAAREDRRLKDLITELLRRGLSQPETEEVNPKVRRRMTFPIIKGRPAPPGHDLTPERVREILLEQEVQAARRGAGLD